MNSYTRSLSLHSIYRNNTHVLNVLNELRRCLPYVRPCYAVSQHSSPYLLSYLHEQKVGLVCYTNEDTVSVNRVGAAASIIISPIKAKPRNTCNEYIVRSVNDIARVAAPRAPAPMLWIKTAISNDGIANTNQMFEYIWAHKYLLNGIVFDIHNFTIGHIPPTMYSYKVATEYVFRNMIIPFEREYGIQTPAIMIDGQEHITKIRHLAELGSYALKEISVINGITQKKPELRLILGALFDSVWGGSRDRIVLASHEYP